VIVSFETRELKEAVLILRAAEARFGAVNAQALIALIADIEAFGDAEQLLAFMGDDAVIGEDDSLSLPVGANYRATFIAAGSRFGRNAGSRVIWSSVTRLKMMEVVGR
jgi:hypothetical protein